MDYQYKLQDLFIIAIFIAIALSLPIMHINSTGWVSSDVFRPMIEIQSAECVQLERLSTGSYWKISFQVKNYDPEAVVFSHVYINDVPVAKYNWVFPVEGELATSMPERCKISPGYVRIYELYMDGDFGNYTSGKSVIIKLRSILPWESTFIKLVTLS